MKFTKRGTRTTKEKKRGKSARKKNTPRWIKRINRNWWKEKRFENRIIHINFSRTFTKQNSFICCFLPIFLLCIWARGIHKSFAYTYLYTCSFRIYVEVACAFQLCAPFCSLLDMIPSQSCVYTRYFTIRCTQFQSSFTCIVLTRAHKIYVYVQ